MRKRVSTISSKCASKCTSALIHHSRSSCFRACLRSYCSMRSPEIVLNVVNETFTKLQLFPCTTPLCVDCAVNLDNLYRLISSPELYARVVTFVKISPANSVTCKLKRYYHSCTCTLSLKLHTFLREGRLIFFMNIRIINHGTAANYVPPCRE